MTLIIRDRVPKRALEKIGLDEDIAAALVTDLVRSGIRIERGSTAVHWEEAPSITRSSTGRSMLSASQKTFFIYF